MSAYAVTAEDLDLEAPVKQRRIIVTSSITYAVWVDDDYDDGAEKIAERLNRDPCDLGDLVRHESAIDGEITARPLDQYDWIDEHEVHGPWRQCPWPTCTTVEYPAYSLDPTCYVHSVIGCQHRNLPERAFPGGAAQGTS